MGDLQKRHRLFTKSDREKFITRQPPRGGKDNYDNENKPKKSENKSELNKSNGTGRNRDLAGSPKKKSDRKVSISILQSSVG